jgi:hypothetical protein
MPLQKKIIIITLYEGENFIGCNCTWVVETNEYKAKLTSQRGALGCSGTYAGRGALV